MSTNELQKMTWGRKAFQRFSKSPEEIKEEVLRSLRGKLSVEFQVNILFELFFNNIKN